MKMKSGMAIAATAAALFASSGVLVASQAYAADADMSVKCSGINSCKGTSECKSATHACKGQNSCKGQGWVHAKSAEECTSKGGKVVK
ncbi:MAG: hypothetical protein EPO06_02130 [Burkholderiaceae bacterium]|nr:MAG: hypothetical protein EPO06_02130 [Burkholderiaceae bacterium]